MASQTSIPSWKRFNHSVKDNWSHRYNLTMFALKFAEVKQEKESKETKTCMVNESSKLTLWYLTSFIVRYFQSWKK